MTDARRIAERHTEWLRQAVQHSGLAPTTFAKACGLTATTVTRRLKAGAVPEQALNAATIAKISAFTGLPGPDGAMPPGMAEPDAVPYVAGEEAQDRETAAVKALVGGREGVDAWVIRTRAVESAGLVPGDIALIDLTAAPKAGEIVVAQIYDRTGSAQTVFRVYDPPYLTAASSDPAFRKPFTVDNNLVVILGVLDARLKTRHAEAA